MNRKILLALIVTSLTIAPTYAFDLEDWFEDWFEDNDKEECPFDKFITDKELNKSQQVQDVIIKQTNDKLNQLDKKITEVDNKFPVATDVVLRDELRQSQSNQDKLINKNTSDIGKLKDKMDNIKPVDTSNLATKNEVNAVNNKVNSNANNIANNKQAIADSNKQINNNRVDIDKNKNNIQSNTNKIKKQQQQLNKHNKELKQQKKKNKNFNNRINKNKNDIKDLNNKFDAIDIPDISNLATKEQVNQSTNQVVSQVQQVSNQVNTNTFNIQQNSKRIEYNAQRIQANTNRINENSNRINSLDNKLESGLATVTALTALHPNPRAKGRTQVAIGSGIYRDNMAGAIGIFHYIKDNCMLSVGASYGGDSNFAGNVGITFGF